MLGISLKIVVDENMPKVAHLFDEIADISYVNGRTLTQSQLLDADALLVRSVTKVNKALLEGSSVKFVGTATIGVDHIDQEYLAQAGIGFASAPGCNADAVADYVMSALSYLYLQKEVAWLDVKIGVIGFGNVGQRVYDRLHRLGCDVVVYDPYKMQDRGSDFASVNFVELAEVMACDIVCLHAPLTDSGDYPTKNMITKPLLESLKAGSSIISAGRGGVLHENSLFERYYELNGKLNLVFDVWDGEPNINLALLNLVDIATPHIAGYSLQGREKGTLMIYRAFCEHFQLAAKFDIQNALTKGAIKCLEPNAGLDRHRLIAKTCHAIYNLAADDAKMRNVFSQKRVGGEFDLLRKRYVERDELSTCKITGGHNDLNAVGFAS
jgi:erythronate-4-phosphate dehydrogenase